MNGPDECTGRVVFAILATAMAVGIPFLMWNHIKQLDRLEQRCEVAGGFPIIGHKGSFIACVDSSSIIELGRVPEDEQKAMGVK